MLKNFRKKKFETAVFRYLPTYATNIKKYCNFVFYAKYLSIYEENTNNTRYKRGLQISKTVYDITTSMNVITKNDYVTQ